MCFEVLVDNWHAPKTSINQTSICFQVPVECALIGGVDRCIVSRASHSCLSHTHYIAPGNTHAHMHTKNG